MSSRLVRSLLVVLVAAGLAVPAGALAASGTTHGVNRAKLAAQATSQIESRNGIDVQNISQCKPKKRKRGTNWKVWSCKWRAEGLWPGEVPYHCAGNARWKKKRKSWRVDPCANRLEAQAPLSAEPGPQPLFGFNELWTMRGEEAYDRLAEADVETARINLDWGVLEYHRGRYIWNEFDYAVRELAQRGIRPFFVLVGAPCWAQPDPARCESGNNQIRPAPAFYDELAAAGVAAAKRYPETIGIEVWNEPNYPLFWGGDWPEPDRYAEMLKTVAGALHAEVPGMPVVSAGPSPHSDADRGAIGYRNFLERLYELGALQHADAIGVHPYPGVGPSESYITRLRVQFAEIQRLQQRFDDTATPLWVTEVGISTTGPNAFDPDHQGRALVEVFTTLRRIGNIPVVIVHSFSDDPDMGAREGGFGVVNPDFSKKPSFCPLVEAAGGSC